MISLATGAIGLLLMAVSGLSHGGHSGHGHGHGGDAHLGHGHAGHVGHAGHDAGAHAGHAGTWGHQGHEAHHAGHDGGGGFQWQSLLSPRVLFSLLVGFGAGGVLAAPLGEPFRAGAAILSAAVFEMLFVAPMWRFFFRFESSPARTLESAVEDDAKAVTNFDASGNGLVAIDVDGQVVQLLATLSADDRALGVRVRSGDVVRVTQVDAARNRCTVRAL